MLLGARVVRAGSMKQGRLTWRWSWICLGRGRGKQGHHLGNAGSLAFLAAIENLCGHGVGVNLEMEVGAGLSLSRMDL